MSTVTTSTATADRHVPILAAESGVFRPDDVDALAEFYHEYGFAVLRGLWGEAQVDALDAACVAVRDRLLAGDLSEDHGTVTLIDDSAKTRFANYVTHVTRVDDTVRAAALDPLVAALAERLIGPCRLMEGDLFGVVYQDARPGPESGYSRIGWHSDWQSGPHLGPLALGGVHRAPRRDQPGQRLPAGGPGQPPVGDPGAVSERERGRGA